MKNNSAILILSAALLFEFSILALLQNAQAATYSINGGFPSGYFGMHWHRSPEKLNSSINAESWRLHDANVAWANVEPVQGAFDFSRLDAAVSLAEKKKWNVLLPLGFPPKWASSSQNLNGPYGYGSSAAPAEIQKWRSYVEAVVSRYAGRIEAYEVWNEPNLKKFFNGSSKDIALLTNEVCSIVRALDPKAKIVSAGPTGVTGLEFLDLYLPDVKPGCLDVIGFHFYTDHKAPERVLDLAKRVKKVSQRHGLGRLPIWNTESGWLIQRLGKSSSPESVGFAGQAKILNSEEASNYIIRAHLIGKIGGLERFYWYAADNEQMGFSSELADVYDKAVVLLKKTTVKQCEEKSGVWLCSIEISGSSARYIAWSEMEEVRLPLQKGAYPADWRNEDCERTSHKKNIVAALVSQTPLIICAERNLEN